jgi:hypothetical protein
VPALNGDYPIDAATQMQVAGIMSKINAGRGLPGGGQTFNWPDAAGIAHVWSAPQFVDFADKLADYIYGCAQVAQGHGDVLPERTLRLE